MGFKNQFVGEVNRLWFGLCMTRVPTSQMSCRTMGLGPGCVKNKPRNLP
jgi:hypothetical protein